MRVRECHLNAVHSTASESYHAPYTAHLHVRLVLCRYARSPDGIEESRNTSSPEQQAPPGAHHPRQPAPDAQPSLEKAALGQHLAASGAATLKVPSCEVPAARDQLPAGLKLPPCREVRGAYKVQDPPYCWHRVTSLVACTHLSCIMVCTNERPAPLCAMKTPVSAALSRHSPSMCGRAPNCAEAGA